MTWLLEKIKTTGKIGVISLASLLPFNNNSYAQETKEKLEPPAVLKEGYIGDDAIVLPQKLTQQTPDFYKNPEKEFEFYRKAFLHFAKDGVINSEEIGHLELILSKTLEEIEEKVKKNDLKINEETYVFIKKYEKFRDEHLCLFKSQLRDKEDWMTNTGRTAYWNWGLSGSISYWGDNYPGEKNRNEKLKIIFKKMKENKSDNLTLLDLINAQQEIEMLYLTNEFPATLKINFWLGLLAGAVLPGILAVSGKFIRERRLNTTIRNYEDYYVYCVLQTIPNPISGIIFLDILHPLAYPIRVLSPAIPLLYESVRLVYDKLRREPVTQTTNLASSDPLPPRRFEGELNMNFQQRVNNYWNDNLRRNETTNHVEPPKQEEKVVEEKKPEAKKKTLIDGKELTEAQEEALNDIKIRFDHLEID